MAGYFLGLDKEYIAKIQLGVTTDSWDMDGNIVDSKEVGVLSREKIEKSLTSFKGEYLQMPPMFSSIKYKGRPAYTYARRGQKIGLKKRKVRIKDISLKGIEDDTITIKVACSSGTYLRSIAHDIGDILGYGASLKELRRLRIGAFSVRCAQALEDIKDLKPGSSLVTLEDLLIDHPEVIIKGEYEKAIKNGSHLKVFMISDIEKIKKTFPDYIKVKNKKKLLAIYQTNKEFNKRPPNIKDEPSVAKPVIIF